MAAIATARLVPLPVQSFIARRPLQVSAADPESPVRLGLACAENVPPGRSYGSLEHAAHRRMTDPPF